MKYTLISKTGKVSGLQITLLEALPVLRARYGDNGRAIIRELLDLVSQERQSQGECVDARNPCPVTARLWALGDLLDPNLPGTFCDCCGIDGCSQTLTRQPANPDPEYVDIGGVAPGDRWLCCECDTGEPL
jgi:hypothetical protein